MFVITADQRGSRRRPDLVPTLLDGLNHDPHLNLTLDFVRTAGDEVQGVTDLPETVARATSLLLRDGDWSVGIGLGLVETPLPAHANEGRGTAYIQAREAVEEAKRRYPTVRLLGSATSSAAADADVLLRLLATIWQRRTPAGWQAVAAMENERGELDPAQATAAQQLGISKQALGQRLRAAAYQPEQDALPLLLRFLSEANETI